MAIPTSLNTLTPPHRRGPCAAMMESLGYVPVEPPKEYEIPYAEHDKLAVSVCVKITHRGCTLFVERDRQGTLYAYVKKAEFDKYNQNGNSADNNHLNNRKDEKVSKSSGSRSHKHCISFNRIYDLLHGCGFRRGGH